METVLLMNIRILINRFIRRSALVMLIGVLPVIVSGQKKIEMGIFTGISSYLGDLNPDLPFHSPQPAIGLLHIYNMNKRFALRSQLAYASLKSPAKDNIGPGFTSQMLDAATRFEVNFKPFKLVDRKRPVTTYINGGLGAVFFPGMSNGSPVQLTLPFGVGVKAGLNRRLCVGIEFSGRKTFTDYIDNIQNNIYTIGNTMGETPNHSFINNDWYTFTGLFLTFKLFDNPGDCPVYPE
jgi:hypothetical protein